MKKRLFSPLLAAALAAAVALTAAALPAFADGGEETPITIGQSQEQQAECTCTVLCTGDNINADCPVCGAVGADLTACEGLEVLPATLSNALPATALAADGVTLRIGNTTITESGYWTTSNGGNTFTYVNGAPSSGGYIHYVPNATGGPTLTLNNVTIAGTYDASNNIEGTGIYMSSSSGSASLTIMLQGDNNQVSGASGIYVFSDSGDASLSISGTGSLTAKGTDYGNHSGIMVQSNGGKAELTINNVDVTATNSNTQGIRLQPAGTSPATLAVNGGSLTAIGSKGIDYQFGTGTTGSGTPTVTVSNNAIVRANGSISNNSSTEIHIGADSSASSGGIVFDGNEGTVYGDVTLQEDLTIGEGESLTVPDGASLNTNGKLTVDGGTLTQNGTVTGGVTYKVTGVSLDKTSLNLNPGKEGTLTATITPDNATNQNVTWKSSDTKVATVDNGLVTAVAEGTATITVTTADGGKTATCEVTVTQPAKTPVTSVTLDKTSLTLDVGGSDTLTATVKPDDATNKAVTWSTSNENVATVNQNGNVKAVGAGTATITAAASDGSGKTATCEVTVNGPVLPPQPSDPALRQPTAAGSGTNSAASRQQGPVVHNVSNSSAYRKGEYEFWMKVRTKIVSAGPGEVIEVNARDNDKMPNSVMQALAAKENVTLRIRWNDGEEIVIPSAAALQEKMRMFYPLSYLAKFDFAQTPAQKVK